MTSKIWRFAAIQSGVACAKFVGPSQQAAAPEHALEAWWLERSWLQPPSLPPFRSYQRIRIGDVNTSTILSWLDLPFALRRCARAGTSPCHLSFVFICGKSRRGNLLLKRKTRRLNSCLIACNFARMRSRQPHGPAPTSVGAELRFANGIALLAKFDGDFASRSSTYAGTGTIRYTW